MKNAYEIRGDVTAILINSKKYGKTETLIDTVDLEKVNNFPNSWYVNYSLDIKGFYAKGCTKGSNGKRKTVLLHRLIMDDPINMLVDHINHDTLDNRKSSNLRKVTSSENQQNKIKARSDNKTGIIGVCWHEIANKWRARININGKIKHLGCFVTIEEAENAVKEARAKHMPFSQESIRRIKL